MIAATQLEKTFTKGSVAVPVLRGVDLTVQRGEYVAVVGTSGSGKTTLLNLVGCLDKPTAGGLEIGGADVLALDDDGLSALRSQRIGFVFQQFILMERTSALDNVLLPFLYSEAYPQDAADRAGRALRDLGMEHRLHHLAGELSGGEQQRVALARALINDPDLLLADEPTGNLDEKNTDDILDIFDRLHGDGRTIVVVTHDRNVATRAQRIVELRDGRIATAAS